MMTLAPLKRDASTVWTRWLATVASTSGAPVMSMTSTLARCVRMPPSSCGQLPGAPRPRAHRRGEAEDVPHHLRRGRRQQVRSVPRRPGRYGQLSGLFAVRDFAVHDRPARSAAARPAPAAGSLERVMGARMSTVAPTARSESGKRRHGGGTRSPPLHDADHEHVLTRSRAGAGPGFPAFVPSSRTAVGIFTRAGRSGPPASSLRIASNVWRGPTSRGVRGEN